MRTSFLPPAVLLPVVLLVMSLAAAQPVGLKGASVNTYFDFPVATDAALISFDWDASDTLHYTVGDPNWGAKLAVYKQATPDDQLVFLSTDVWAGSQMLGIGDYMYFNDGGDLTRSESNYYMYEPVQADTVTPVLEHPYGMNLSGLASRNFNEFFASGTEVDWGPAALFYSTLDASGNLDDTPVKFAGIGESPGPMTFDNAGNLYYAHGYVFGGAATVYRWDAAAVAAALADPDTAALVPTGNEWATLPTPYDGATGITVDSHGNIYVTVTAWMSPSQLVVYTAGDASMFRLAEYEGRLESLRYRDNAVYFSCADGVFAFPLPQAIAATETLEIVVHAEQTALFAIKTLGDVGTLNYQWYRVSEDEIDMPVGDNLPSYAITAAPADSDAQFYCVVTDDNGSFESPTFTLEVLPPMPTTSRLPLLLCAALLVILAALQLSRGIRLTRKTW